MGEGKLEIGKIDMGMTLYPVSHFLYPIFMLFINRYFYNHIVSN